MALTDVVSAYAVDRMSRGDIGTVEDVVTAVGVDKLFLTVPAASEVETGVQYGQQGTELTGTFVGGGGGGHVGLIGG